MKDLPVRKNIRLKDYDYSRSGAYFITICVKDRHEMLGRIDVGAGSARPLSFARRHCELSSYGIIVDHAIKSLCEKYPQITIDKYVIMPNHIHLIIIMSGRADPDGRADPAPTTIGQIMGYFKYKTTKDIDIRGFWQRSYHDHIIRSEAEYQKIWQYIDENPAGWAEDCYYN